MENITVLEKMDTEIGNPISYKLKVGDDWINVNELIGQKVSISLEGYQCLACGQEKKIYRQGHCYDCFYEQPAVGDWVMKPELSTAHLGIEDRDIDFERMVQLKPHVVYLALSSNVKVGVTRKTQVPTRWIDQGANFALPIVEVPNRYLAGLTEVALKNHLSDKTNWRKMLQNIVPDEDLKKIRDEVFKYLPKEVEQYKLDDAELVALDFPVEQYPAKLKSLNLEKTLSYEGVLKGIKGQYLIFEDETVFNVRSNEGAKVKILS